MRFFLLPSNYFSSIITIFENIIYLCIINIPIMDKRANEILDSIKVKIASIMPSDAKVILFGSQARGDAKDDSDWDILILLDKDKLDESDHDKFSYPLFELGWQIDAQIHPILYTLKDWLKRSISPFYKNVEQDGIELC
jgi:predicted nucleotidyltransferase